MAKRNPPLYPLYTLVALGPNGAELSREAHAFSTSPILRQRAAEIVTACRDFRGFTPIIRCYMTDRSVTPFEDSDVTETMLGPGW